MFTFDVLNENISSQDIKDSFKLKDEKDAIVLEMVTYLYSETAQLSAY